MLHPYPWGYAAGAGGGGAGGRGDGGNAECERAGEWQTGEWGMGVGSASRNQDCGTWRGRDGRRERTANTR
jgi:hypothetical protein